MLRRRKWIVIQAIVLVPLVAWVHASRQPTIYSSNAQVLVSQQNVASVYAGLQNPAAGEDPTRYAATQAFLARSPSLVARVLTDSHVHSLTVAQFLAASHVAALPNADILIITVQDLNPLVARKLAAVYARDFTLLRHRLDTAALGAALSQLQKQIASLKRAGELSTPTGQTLLSREQELQTLSALESQNAYLARPASVAVQVFPRPKRDAILGLVLGVVLGVGLAFLRDVLDTRVKSTDEVTERLGLPILGRAPTPPKTLDERQLVMLEQPYTPEGEMFRMLRTNFDLVNLDPQVRTVMVTSALEGEGKTTTAANLAVALAAAGRRVVLVDLDLRRPTLAWRFELQPYPGITEVALGVVELNNALAPIDVSHLREGAVLNVLPAGRIPPNPAEFVSTRAMLDLLAELESHFDVVVDSPPILHAAEALTLTAHIEGLILVTRLSMVTRGVLSEVARLLAQSPVAKLGVVIAGATAAQSYELEHYSSTAYSYPDQDLVS